MRGGGLDPPTHEIVVHSTDALCPLPLTKTPVWNPIKGPILTDFHAYYCRFMVYNIAGIDTYIKQAKRKREALVKEHFKKGNTSTDIASNQIMVLTHNGC